MKFHSALTVQHTFFHIAVALVALAWSTAAFCGEIHEAAAKGDVEKVKALLKMNPELVNARDESGWTPLHRAALQDQVDVVKLLLSDTCDVNSKDNGGSTPLHLATWRGHKELAELLLLNGADVNAKDQEGRTPLHWATWKGPQGKRGKELAELLLANMAEVNAKDNDGNTPLHSALRTQQKLQNSPKLLDEINQVINVLRLHGAKE